MTVRLAAIFEDHMSKIIENWKIAKTQESDENSDEETSRSSLRSSTSRPESTINPVSRVNNKIESSGSDSEDMPLEVLKTGNRTNTETDSTSQEVVDDQVHVEEEQSSNSESEESYKPEEEYAGPSRNSRTTRKRHQTTSDEEEEEQEEDVEEETTEDSDDYNNYRRKRTSLRKRPARKKQFYASPSDDSDDDCLSVNTRSKRRKLASDSDSDDRPLRTPQEGEQNGTYFSSVSSRGRLRKLTPRAIALMKK